MIMGIAHQVATRLLQISIFLGTLAYAESFDNAVESSKLVVLLFSIPTAIIISVFGVLLNRRESLSFEKFQFGLCLITLFLITQAIVSAFYGEQPYFVWKDLPLYLCSASLFIAFVSGFFDKEDAVRFFDAFTLAAIINAVIGLYQAYFGPIEGIREVAAPAGLYGNRNFSSEITAVALPLCLGMLLKSKRKAVRFALSMGLALLAAYALICFSRGALLALVLTGPILVFALYLDFKKVPKKWLLRTAMPLTMSLFLTVILFSLPKQYNSNAYNLIEEKVARTINQAKAPGFDDVATVDKSLKGRWVVWVNSIEAFNSRPFFGHGFGSWQSVYMGYAQSKLYDGSLTRDSSMHHAHNFYVEFLVGMGIFGAALICGGAIIGFWQFARRAIRNGLDSPMLLRDSLWIASLGIILITAFFSMPLEMPTLPFVAATLFASLTMKDPHAEPATGAVGGKIFMCLAVFLLISSAYTIFRANEIRKVEIMAEELDYLFHQKRNDDALSLGKRLLMIDRHHVTANNRMAILLYEQDPESWYPYLRNIEIAYPNRPTNLAFLANNFSLRGENERALEYWERLVQIVPQDEMGLQQATILAHRQGDLEKAIDYCQKLVAIFPENVSYQKTFENLIALKKDR